MRTPLQFFFDGANLGPTFGDELKAAGLHGLPFSWLTDGTILGRENLTEEQNTALDQVIGAHDPAQRQVPFYSTLLIYRSLRAISPGGAHVFLSEANPLDSAEFLAAPAARLDEPYVVDMLDKTGVTALELEAEILRQMQLQPDYGSGSTEKPKAKIQPRPASQ